MEVDPPVEEVQEERVKKSKKSKKSSAAVLEDNTDE